MKKILLVLFIASVSNISYSQILNPVKFNYSAVKKSSSQYEVHIKTSIDPKWHIYSVKNPEGGAQATLIKIKDGNPIGDVKESGILKTGYNEEFKVNEKYFEKAVDFVQLVKLNSGIKEIGGTIEYMVCNDKQCLPPKEVEFKIKL